jgi:chromosome segregation protein
VHFQRLRLSGFKSFVDQTDLLIEPGLTGIVGPNGCGKSNLLEALRWVMGAASAKAMRAEGMDDVIFGGTSARPSRNYAEVSLQIDNSDRRAPPAFNDRPMIEVVRRITRGAGSSYRVNGVEARAKDVQLLFADASTGANSPSLVRQGQISELIAAKPSNRRRILEEAAGVSGLHSRRHEADLRLKAAEANLLRLDDVLAELESALNRLKREARAAERYKRLQAEIRQIQSAALLSRWQAAQDAQAAAEAALREAERRAQESQGVVARAATAAAGGVDALQPLRDAEAAAAAVLQRLLIERERAERDALEAQAEAKRLQAEGQRLRAEGARAQADAEDAQGQAARLAQDLADLDAQIAAAPQRLPDLEAAASRAEAARATADAEVERLAAAVASAEAEGRAAQARIEAARQARRAADARIADAGARHDRAASALAQARAQAETDGAPPADAGEAAALAAAQAELDAARARLAEAEAARAKAQAKESAARDAARAADDSLRRLRTEAQGLMALARPAADPGRSPPVIDSVAADPGYEAALAAALAEDELDAGLDAKSPAFWAGADVAPPVWPAGVEPLSAHVVAPSPLAVRIAWTGVAEARDGARLAKGLPPGARLVSKAGDLWRWDGFTARADAPRPAAKRLQQKARLSALEGEIARAGPLAASAQDAHAEAAAAVRAAEQALAAAREAPRRAEAALAHAREAMERRARAEAAAAARREGALAAVSRAEAALAEAAADVARAEADRAALPPVPEAPAAPADSALPRELLAARAAAALAREAAAAARAALDGERRARDGRARRRQDLARDLEGWIRREAAAQARLEELATRAQAVRNAHDAALAAAPAAARRRQDAADAYAGAERRRAEAADALSRAAAAQADADRLVREAEAAASAAREARAAAQARVEAGAERLAAAEAELRRVTQADPLALTRRLAESAAAVPADPAAIEQHLHALERQRDAIGPVNLRAEEEAQEQSRRLDALAAERADLAEAVTKLRAGIAALNAEGRERVLAAFAVIDRAFRALFEALFEGGAAELRLVENDDPLEAGLEIFACPPGKKLAAMSLMSGGEQALTATALIFAVFLANPSPVCVLDEVDAPLDDANVDRFCRLLDEMRTRTDTRFIAITHNPVTMSRMDRLFGVTMAERGVSQLVSVDLRAAAALAAE